MTSTPPCNNANSQCVATTALSNIIECVQNKTCTNATSATRVLTSGERTDVHIVRYAGRAWYDTLLSAGVRVYEWQPTTLHAKTFVVDGEWSTIGSMNFDNRSLSLNDEATLMVRDLAVGERMTQIFLDDLKLSEEIALEAFRRRSWFQRGLEWGSGLFRRVL